MVSTNELSSEYTVTTTDNDSDTTTTPSSEASEVQDASLRNPPSSSAESSEAAEQPTQRRGYVFTKFTSLFIMLLIFGFITEEDQIKIGLTLGNPLERRREKARRRSRNELPIGHVHLSFVLRAKEILQDV